MLRRFAAAITDVADSIIGADVSTPFADSEAALPGTEFAHGTAGEYEVSEADFTGMLHAMDVPA
ncbi:hypothetical protein EF834_08410 [Rhodococcus spongiicola]|uniref:Uncharacterized protein n=2 Tax=Rhodococcus spongiicola TaxID=2487352 RepID=A0A438AYB5_9NOCA|nr:hypothetical protein EF834_08410 [Rhodococcus spongiicola]